jgi:hypothetical protein
LRLQCLCVQSFIQIVRIADRGPGAHAGQAAVARGTAAAAGHVQRAEREQEHKCDSGLLHDVPSPSSPRLPRLSGGNVKFTLSLGEGDRSVAPARRWSSRQVHEKFIRPRYPREWLNPRDQRHFRYDKIKTYPRLVASALAGFAGELFAFGL